MGAQGVNALKCVIKKPEAPVPIKATDPWRLVDDNEAAAKHLSMAAPCKHMRLPALSAVDAPSVTSPSGG